jgi:hypothetical protein
MPIAASAAIAGRFTGLENQTAGFNLDCSWFCESSIPPVERFLFWLQRI